MTDNSSKRTEVAARQDGGSRSQKLPIVGIGVSAGGLEAIRTFFGKMPTDTGMAFVMIPHLDPGHKSLMAEIIGRCTAMPTVQVEDRIRIEPDHIYVVQPNRNLAIEDGELVSCEISRTRGINLPVDFFFRSLAEAQRERAIGIILSGTMRDGAMGLKDIKEHGGLVVAQSPETAQHDGMPRSAIDTGMVDLVLPVEGMPDAIVNFITHPYIHREIRAEDENGDQLNQVLAVIRARSRHDLGCYKRNTLVRRTERRMGLRQIERMADYVEILKNDRAETDALLKDLLIGVTGFFREEQVWDVIARDVLPAMLDDLEPGTPVRLWIPGCSTGEEAYTLAMLVHDAFERANRRVDAQIFATDIDADAISVARAGSYPESIAANVPPEYLEKYFIRDDHAYRVLRRIRESVVFAVQNLVADAPFSNLNLISCRNLLIYLNPDIQQNVIELFHFSMRENGCLILGKSETIGHCEDLFEPVSGKLRIYRRVGRRGDRMPISLLRSLGRLPRGVADARIELSRKRLSAFMQTQLLERFAPPAVLVDRNGEILNLHGPTSRYLDLPQGDPLMELTSMVKEGLRLKLRSAVRQVVKTNEAVTVSDARVKRGRRFHPVSFTVRPINGRGFSDPLLLVTFEDRPAPVAAIEREADLDLSEETLVRQLETELMSTREDLQNTIDELEISSEEIKASNEEMMSMNEELQSSNEELETSKEELQSMNEELNTVNAELREKIRELESTNNDLANLMNSTEVATVFLDVDMAIRQFTPAAKHLFNLIPSDIGRPIADLAMRFNDDDLRRDASKVMETLAPSMKEVSTEEGRWYIRRILPFKTLDNRVDGLVLTFSNVTGLKESEIAIRDNEGQLREKSQLLAAVLEHTHMMAAYLDPQFNFVWVNHAYAESCGHEPTFFQGKNHFALYPHEENERIFSRVVETGEAFFVAAKPFEFPDQPERGVTYWDWGLIPTEDPEGNVTGLVFTLAEVTDRIRAEDALRKKEQEFRNIVANLPGFFFRYRLKPDGSDDLLYVSNGVEELFEVPRDDAVNDVRLLWERIHPDDFETTVASVRESAANLSFWELKYRIKLPDGRVKWLHGRGVPARQEDGSVVWDTLGIDISDVMVAEEAIREALAEKEVLLREIHHRVKNNMQVIIGLLRLQADCITEPQALAAFEDSQSRIMAMAQVHDTLYRSGTLSSVSCRTYVTKLVDGVAKAHRMSGVEVLIDVCDEPIPIDQAIPLGLVVTEIMSNAMKHAFPNGRSGQVALVMRLVDGQRFELEVSDDGIGMTEDIDFDGTGSLGLHLVNILVLKQLNGSLDISCGSGTRFTIAFERVLD